MISDVMQGSRPCIVTIAGEEHRGLLLDIGFKMWTRGASVTIGGCPAGQESHPVAIVELDNGKVSACDLDCLRMLDTDGLFSEFSWEETHDR